MTRSTITRDRIEQYANDPRMCNINDEIREMARMALAALDSEPVAEVVSIYGDPEAFGEREIRPLVGIQQMPYGTKLYRHAQQPVVPDDVLDALQKVARIRLDLNDFDGDRRGIADCLGDAEEALIEVVNRRAAMLQGAKNSESRVGIQTAPALDSSPKTADARCGNSPVIPDGYVMVPIDLLSELRDWAHPEIEKYCEMWKGRRDSEFPALRKVIADADAMVAAAPQPQNAQQNIPEIIPGWIPVSERMPENDVSVLTFDGMYRRVHHAMYGHWQCWNSEKITHWMPLPAAPQEVPDGK